MRQLNLKLCFKVHGMYIIVARFLPIPTGRQSKDKSRFFFKSPIWIWIRIILSTYRCKRWATIINCYSVKRVIIPIVWIWLVKCIDFPIETILCSSFITNWKVRIVEWFILIFLLLARDFNTYILYMYFMLFFTKKFCKNCLPITPNLNQVESFFSNRIVKLL